MNPTRVLGVDYGHVRVGLAISDADRRIASPLRTLQRRGSPADADMFRRLIAEEGVNAIVIGLPVHLSGQEGQKAREARRFGEWLARETGYPVRYWDERFSTVEAETHLLAAGLTSKRRRERRDRVAAQIILQSYLDAGCPANASIGPLDEPETPNG